MSAELLISLPVDLLENVLPEVVVSSSFQLGLQHKVLDSSVLLDVGLHFVFVGFEIGVCFDVAKMFVVPFEGGIVEAESCPGLFFVDFVLEVFEICDLREYVRCHDSFGHFHLLAHVPKCIGVVSRQESIS